MKVYTSERLCKRVGVTYRVLDYWDRTATFRPSGAPAAGSGSKRLYTEDDAAVATVLVRLNRLGASTDVLRVVADHLRARPCIGWPTRVYVTKDGSLALTASGLDDGGWVVPTRSGCCAAAA